MVDKFRLFFLFLFLVFSSFFNREEGVVSGFQLVFTGKLN